MGSAPGFLRLSFALILVALLSPAKPIPARTVNTSARSDFVQRVSASLCQEMRVRQVLSTTFRSCDRLRVVRFSHVNFRNEILDDGAVVVLDALSDHVLELFQKLREIRFPIEKAVLMNQYNGDDDASMADNNTSAFNDRNILGKRTLSLHAYGAAIDVNPVLNPCLTRNASGMTEINPPAGAKYADRTRIVPGMAEPVAQIFFNHGFFIWGGNWRSLKDYQHFQVSRDVVKKLVDLSPERARRYFNEYVRLYRACVNTSVGSKSSAVLKCKGHLQN